MRLASVHYKEIAPSFAQLRTEDFFSIHSPTEPEQKAALDVALCRSTPQTLLCEWTPELHKRKLFLSFQILSQAPR